MPAPRKPVFCGPCRFFSSGYSDRYFEHCGRARTRQRYVRTHLEERTDQIEETPAEKNAWNDCGDFEKREA